MARTIHEQKQLIFLAYLDVQKFHCSDSEWPHGDSTNLIVLISLVVAHFVTMRGKHKSDRRETRACTNQDSQSSILVLSAENS